MLVYLPKYNEKGYHRSHDGVISHKDKGSGIIRRVGPKASEVRKLQKAARKAERAKTLNQEA